MAAIRQERIIAVPIGISHFYSNSWSGVGTSIIATFLPTAAQIAALRACIYFYYANVSLSIGAAVANMAFTIEIQWRTSGGVAVGGPFPLARGRVGQSATTAVPWVFAPMAPYGAIGNMPATATKVDFQISYSAGANVPVDFTMAAFMDPANTSGDGEIGFGALWSPAVFEAIGKPFPFF